MVAGIRYYVLECSCEVMNRKTMTNTKFLITKLLFLALELLNLFLYFLKHVRKFRLSPDGTQNSVGLASAPFDTSIRCWQYPLTPSCCQSSSFCPSFMSPVFQVKSSLRLSASIEVHFSCRSPDFCLGCIFAQY